MFALLCCLIATETDPAPSDAARPAAWTMFRGGDGITDGATRLPADLSVGARRWRTGLPGRGWSSPVFADGLLWMTTALDDGRDLRLLAVDAATGERMRDIGVLAPADVQEIHSANSYASPTPCVAEGRVFAHFGRYGTAAVDAASGEVVWTDTKHPIEHGGGPGSSPVMAAGRLIITLDGADATYVMALDPATGEEVWRTPRSGPQRDNPIVHRAFATPLVTDWDGRPVVVVPGADQVNAYDAASGQELWQVRYVGFSTVPQPVRWRDRVFVATGFPKPQLLGIDLGGSGNVTDSHQAWAFRGPVPTIASPVIALGTVWIVSDKGVLTGVDAASGDRAAVERLGGNFSSSPVVVTRSDDAATLVVGSRERELLVVDLTREDGDTAAEVRETIDIAEPIYATPLLMGDRLVLRTADAIWCW